MRLGLYRVVGLCLKLCRVWVEESGTRYVTSWLSQTREFGGVE